MMKLIVTSMAVLLAISPGALGRSAPISKVLGSGIPKSEKRVVPAFDTILIEGAHEVEIVCQGNQSIEIAGDDNVIPLVLTEVRGHTLHIFDVKNLAPKLKLTITITIPRVEDLSVIGSADVRISTMNNIHTNLKLIGSGNIKVSGSSHSVQMSLSGSGSIAAADLAVDDMTVEVNGSGRARVRVTNRLEASVEGSGEVVYYGQPRSLANRIIGSGSIRKGLSFTRTPVENSAATICEI